MTLNSWPFFIHVSILDFPRMETLMRILVLASLATLLSACATGTSTSWSQTDCLDGRKDVRDFEMLAPDLVRIKQSGYHEYEVTLAEACPELSDATSVGFSNGPARYLGRTNSGQPIWGNSLSTGRICGRGFDSLVVSTWGNAIDHPRPTCKISSVRKIQR